MLVDLKGIELGMKVRDKITTLEGVMIGVCVHMTGCHQALVTPVGLNKDGKRFESEWFDLQRLEQVGTDIIKLDNSKTPGAESVAVPPRS